jgi:hypothetical protein
MQLTNYIRYEPLSWFTRSQILPGYLVDKTYSNSVTASRVLECGGCHSGEHFQERRENVGWSRSNAVCCPPMLTTLWKGIDLGILSANGSVVSGLTMELPFPVSTSEISMVWNVPTVGVGGSLRKLHFVPEAMVMDAQESSACVSDR